MAPVAASDLAFPVKAPPVAGLYDWSGWYVGGHMAYAAGRSNWTAPGAVPASGSLNLFQPADSFAESGSGFMGFQAGANGMLSNRVVLGVEADVSFPNWPDVNGLSIGDMTTFASPTLGPVTFTENVVASGTLRGRIGYAPGNVLFYATGGLAWNYNQQTLTLADGTAQWPSGGFAAGRLRVCAIDAFVPNTTDLTLIGSGRVVSEHRDDGAQCVPL